jgi:hypothetical protein
MRLQPMETSPAGPPIPLSCPALLAVPPLLLPSLLPPVLALCHGEHLRCFMFRHLRRGRKVD